MRRHATIKNAENHLPLSPAVFHILLALSQGAKHGYGVIVDIRERTAGEVLMGTGTLYTAVKRLLSQGLLEQVEGQDEKGENRLFYSLSALGEEALRAEALRLERLVGLARRAGQL